MAFIGNCGSTINLLSANKGVHGYDYHGSLYQGTVRSESSSDQVSQRSGQACQSAVLLGVAAFGDASIPTAKSNGGISKINHIAYSKTRILGPVYMKDCIIVYGD